MVTRTPQQRFPHGPGAPVMGSRGPVVQFFTRLVAKRWQPNTHIGYQGSYINNTYSTQFHSWAFFVPVNWLGCWIWSFLKIGVLQIIQCESFLGINQHKPSIFEVPKLPTEKPLDIRNLSRWKCPGLVRKISCSRPRSAMATRSSWAPGHGWCSFEFLISCDGDSQAIS